MLTVMAMRWNQHKFDNLATTLAHRYRKVKTPVLVHKCFCTPLLGQVRRKKYGLPVIYIKEIPQTVHWACNKLSFTTFWSLDWIVEVCCTRAVALKCDGTGLYEYSVKQCCIWFSYSERNWHCFTTTFKVVCISLIVSCHLCLKATIALQSQLHNLEAMKTEMDITDHQLESWLIDINEWAEGRIYCFTLLDMLLDV